MNAIQKVNGGAVQAPQPEAISAAVMEQVIGKGDISSLTPAQRVEYLTGLSRSMGLNPLTRPIQLLTLSGKTVAYATRDCTDQLRKIHGVSLRIVGRERLDDAYVVTAQATDSTGRVDESTGAVVVGNLKGEALCNALMKAETKAKRRVTLSICGLGLLDESELDTVPTAKPLPPDAVEDAVVVNHAHMVEKAEPKAGNAKFEFARMVSEISAFKERIGATEYYRVLGTHGVEHANEVRSRNQGIEIFRALADAADRLARVPATDNENPQQITDDDLPSEMWEETK